MHIYSVLKDRAEKKLNTFVLQIGAMDGKTGDPIYEHLHQNNWEALLVEPAKNHFEALKQNYQNRPLVKLCNHAIANHSGEIKLYRIEPKAVEAGNVPKWGLEASSIYKDRTAIAWDKIKPYVYEEIVPCLTLPDLLKKFKINNINVLQIDAEGHDYQILKQLDFKIYQPSVINLEIVNLPEEELELCKNLLKTNGYIYEKTGYDLIAVKTNS